MFKFDTQSWIENSEGVRKDIIIKYKLPCDPLSLIVGIGLITMGVSKLMGSSFKNGARKFEQTEAEVMDSLGLFK